MTTLPFRGAARNAWTERLGRAGFAAKGLLYMIVAVIAIKVALGGGGQPEDQRGALATLADEPFGSVLLVIVALGLSGYAIWRGVEVVVGPRDASGSEAYAKRGASLVRGVLYGALAVVTWMIPLGRGGGSGTAEKEQTAVVLGWRGGVFLVAGVGIGVLAVAAAQAYKAATSSFLDDLALERTTENEWRAVTLVGGIGHAARAVVFGLIGFFLVKAAVQYDPSETRGLDGALKELAARPYGAYFLGLVAGGLFLFGLYCFVEARYRKL